MTLTSNQIQKSKAHKKIVRELAYEMAVADGFGGKLRTLHTEDRPDLAGKILRVKQVRAVKTGRYYPPSWDSGSWEEPGYWEPGGLSDVKVHRLVSLLPDNWIVFRELDVNVVEIEACNLKKMMCGHRIWCGISPCAMDVEKQVTRMRA